MPSFERRQLTISARGEVEEVEVRFVVEDAAGEVWITDIQLQGGEQSTLWAAHPAELRWSWDLT